MKINEQTSISISLVVTLVGGIIWLSYIAFQTTANSSQIVEIKQSAKDELAYKKEVIERLSRIEEALKHVAGK